MGGAKGGDFWGSTAGVILGGEGVFTWGCCF